MLKPSSRLLGSLSRRWLSSTSIPQHKKEEILQLSVGGVLLALMGYEIHSFLESFSEDYQWESYQGHHEWEDRGEGKAGRRYLEYPSLQLELATIYEESERVRNA